MRTAEAMAGSISQPTTSAPDELSGCQDQDKVAWASVCTHEPLPLGGVVRPQPVRTSIHNGAVYLNSQGSFGTEHPMILFSAASWQPYVGVQGPKTRHAGYRRLLCKPLTFWVLSGMDFPLLDISCCMGEESLREELPKGQFFQVTLSALHRESTRTYSLHHLRIRSQSANRASQSSYEREAGGKTRIIRTPKMESARQLNVLHRHPQPFHRTCHELP